MRKIGIPVVAALALVAVPAAPAHVSAYSKVLNAYETTGTISPCQFSSAQLASALKGVDTYSAQYFADFTAAIQSALASRASGVCTRPSSQASAAASASHAASGGTLHLRPLTAGTDGALPLPLVVLAVIALLGALLATVASAARVRGWSPAWVTGWRHAWDEAGYRVGGIWSEFLDWLKSGR